MKNGMLINLDRCSGCQTCTVACKHENNIPLGEYWCTVEQVGPAGVWPDIEQYWLTHQCQQCDNAPCVEVCPTGASYREDQFGLVVVNADECIGCQLCMEACTFGARTYRASEGIVTKCTACVQRLEKNEKPACVHNCCCGARFFGDFDDPESDVSKELAKYGPEAIHQLVDETGASPRTIYILSPEIAAWVEK